MKAPLRTDQSFQRLYDCQVLSETTPTRAQHYFYPGASTQGGLDGLILEVTPLRGPAWIGTFAPGDIAKAGVTGVFTMPNPREVCVVVGSQGYLVNVEAPTTWETIRAIPIIDVRPIPQHNLVIFANFTELFAYGLTGLAWRTKRLAWDGLTLVAISKDSIHGEYWDYASDTKKDFVVDLQTGNHVGGIPEKAQ